MPTRNDTSFLYDRMARAGQSNSLSEGLVDGLKKLVGNRSGQAAQQRINEINETYKNTKAAGNNLVKAGIPRKLANKYLSKKRGEK